MINSQLELHQGKMSKFVVKLINLWDITLNSNVNQDEPLLGIDSV